MNSKSTESIQVGKLYRHYKGNFYKVIAIGRHSESLEDMVVYETQYENPMGRIWIRPAAMFAEVLEVEGQMVPRFSPVDLPNTL